MSAAGDALVWLVSAAAGTAALCAVLAGCTPAGGAAASTAAPAATAPSSARAPAATAPSSARAPAATLAPADDVAAIRAAIDAINATAGGPIADQRAQLQRSVTPSQAADQRACPPATSTLAFEPVYPDTRRAPGAAGGIGTAYLVPSLITIYTGDHITGSDITTLRLWVSDGRASTAALCVA